HTNACLAHDRYHPDQYLAEEPVQAKFTTLASARLVEVHQEVDVNVPIACMAEAGYRQTMLFLESRRKTKDLFEASSRNHNVLVQLGQARVAQSVREFAAKTPDFFTGFG